MRDYNHVEIIIVACWKKSTNFLKFAEGQFHFPKWSGFFKDKPATWSQIQEDGMCNFALLPYLTRAQFVEDPVKLLRSHFLRTQYSPEAWVPFDTTQTRGAWKSGLVDLEYADYSVVMYGAGYGKLTPWESLRAHRGETMGYARAHLVIEATI
jgi:hypothetical protein